MPEPTPNEPIQTTPPAVTPAGPEPAAPTPTPDVPEAPGSGRDDPLLQRLFMEMGVPPEITAAEPGPAPAVPDAPAVPAGEPPPAKPDDKPEKPEKPARKPIEVMPFPDETKPVPAPAAPVAPSKEAELPATAEVAGHDPEAELPEDRRDELKEYQWAEANLGGRYKGHAQRLLDWYKRFDERLNAAVTEDPEFKLDAESGEFRKWMRDKPAIEAGDQRRLQRGLAQEEALAKLKEEQAKLEAKLNEKQRLIERRQRELELKPVLEGTRERFLNVVTKFLAEDEQSPAAAAARALMEDPGKVPEEVRLEAKVIQDTLDRGQRVTQEWLRFANDLTEYDPNNAQHQWLARFVATQCEDFAKRGGDQRVRDGKTFVTRQQWAEMAAKEPAKLAEHFTFSTEDVVGLLAVHNKVEIDHRVRQMTEWAKEHGLERVKPAATAKPSPPPPEVNPTRAQPGRATAGAVLPAPNTHANEIDVVATLGYLGAPAAVVPAVVSPPPATGAGGGGNGG